MFLPSGRPDHTARSAPAPAPAGAGARSAAQTIRARSVRLRRGLESPGVQAGPAPKFGSLESGFTALGINVGVQLFQWLYVQQLASQVQNGLKTGAVNSSAAPMPCRVRLSCHPRLRRLHCKRCKACGLTPRRGVFTTDKRSLTSKTVL